MAASGISGRASGEQTAQYAFVGNRQRFDLQRCVAAFVNCVITVVVDRIAKLEESGPYIERSIVAIVLAFSVAVSVIVGFARILDVVAVVVGDAVADFWSLGMDLTVLVLAVATLCGRVIPRGAAQTFGLECAVAVVVSVEIKDGTTYGVFLIRLSVAVVILVVARWGDERSAVLCIADK